ncbi:MAG: NnrS family protein [Rhodospirillales bacterium]
MTPPTRPQNAATPAGSALGPGSYAGPLVFERGFRPFFLLAGLAGVVFIPVWLLILQGGIEPTLALEPQRWHAHEMAFGFFGAAMAGFLLTAVPNWSGCPPLRGGTLALLGGFWLLGRLAMGLGGDLPFPAVLAADLLFWAYLLVRIGAQVRLAVGYHNYPVVLALALMMTAAGSDHLGLPGAEAGLQVLTLLVALIGGRIVPNFTRNWLQARKAEALPVPPGWLDHGSLVLHLVAGLCWVFALPGAGWLLAATGLAHGVRLTRWQGLATLAEPLLAILHLGYLGVAAGLVGLGLARETAWIAETDALHGLAIVGLAVMAAAVMTRATLGHSGAQLTAGALTVALYALILLGGGLRLAAGLMETHWQALIWAAGGAWTLGFALFLIGYAPLMVRRRQ